MMYRQLHLNSVVPENCLYTPSYGNVNRGNYDKPVDGMGNDQNAQNPFFVTNQSHPGSVWFGMVRYGS